MVGQDGSRIQLQQRVLAKVVEVVIVVALEVEEVLGCMVEEEDSLEGMNEE